MHALGVIHQGNKRFGRSLHDLGESVVGCDMETQGIAVKCRCCLNIFVIEKHVACGGTEVHHRLSRRCRLQRDQ